MANETSAPPAAPAAPVTPAPAAPATPAIPAAQKSSMTPPPAAKPTLPKAVSVEEGLRKVRDEVFKNEGQVAPEVADKLTQTQPPAAPAEKKTETPPVTPKTEPAAIPADKDPIDDIPMPAGLSEKGVSDWKTYRESVKKEMNAIKNEKAALAAKLKTYETATPADSAKAARLEEELKAAHDKLAILSLQDTPDFHRQYVEPKKKALAEAKTLLEANLIENTPDFTALMTKPLKEFSTTVSELAAKMPAYDQGAFVASMREAYRLQGEERGALSKAGELRQAFEAKAAATARQAFEETRNEFTSKVPELQIPEGTSEERAAEIKAYNEARAEALKEAERYSFGKISEKEVAQISQQAAALKVVAKHVIPSLQRDLAQSRELVKQLTSELEAIKKGKNPGQFTEGAQPPTEAPQDRNAKAPNFRAVAQQVGLR